MKKLFVALILLGMAAPRAANTDSSFSNVKFIVGLGGGFEAGNGLQLGMQEGKNAGDLGLGLLYDGQTAEFKYSLGFRYLRTLYSGRVNDTYAWTGAGVMGHRRTGDAGHLVSVGAGVGLSLHFGMPFHLNFDSGWHGYRDSESSFTGVQFGPTINGSLVYEW